MKNLIAVSTLWGVKLALRSVHCVMQQIFIGLETLYCMSQLDTIQLLVPPIMWYPAYDLQPEHLSKLR